MRLCKAMFQAVFLLATLISPAVQTAPYDAGNAGAQFEYLNVGYVETPGYIEFSKNDGMSGMVYEYMETVAAYMGTRLIYHKCRLTQCGEWLADGTVDVLVNEPVERVSPKARDVDLSRYPISKMLYGLYLKSAKTTRGNTEPLSIGFCEDFIPRETAASMLRESGAADGQDFILIPYRDQRLMMRDYYSNYIDGVTLSMSKQNIDEFASSYHRMFLREAYYMVKKGNREVLEALDAAANQLALIHPGFREHMYARYRDLKPPLRFSEEEQEYIRRKGHLKVIVNPNMRPFGYYSEGEYQGIIADVLNELGQKMGIYIDIHSAQSRQDLEDGARLLDADVMASFYYDYNWGHQNKVRLTLPYMTINFVRVTSRNTMTSEVSRIACPSGFYFTHANIERMHSKEQLIYLPSIEECLRAVDDGLADATYVPEISFHQYMERDGYYNLVSDAAVQFSHQISMAVKATEDPLLISVINKTLADIGSRTIYNFVARQSMHFLNSTHPLKRFFYSNPVLAPVLVGGLMGLVILIMLGLLVLWKRNVVKLRLLVYADPNFRMNNLRWFVEKVPPEIEEHLLHARPGDLYVFVMKILHFDLLLDSHDAAIINKKAHMLLRRVKDQHPCIHEMASASDRANIYLLCAIYEPTAPEEIAASITRCAALNQDGDPTIHFDFITGVSKVPEVGDINIERLIAQADRARQLAMSLGRSVCVYDEQQERKDIFDERVASLMYQALERDEFKVWLQYKYDLFTGEVVGAEALARWDSADLGFLTPDKFIPLFEKNGFVLQLDYYILRKVCRMQQELKQAGARIVPVSVNQSGLHMSEDEYLIRIEEIASEYQVEPDMVELELTETALVDFGTKESKGRTEDIIRRLRELGFSLSMDDFCTGYSSIAMLQSFPMDVMKIDRSLLVTAAEGGRAEDILRSVIAMGRNLNMMVICEGVETRQQVEMLRKNNCRYGQGNLMSVPFGQDIYYEQAKKGRLSSWNPYPEK